LDGIRSAFDVVLGNLDRKIGLDRVLVADLLPDPGSV
jgi:hypothetical protein